MGITGERRSPHLRVVVIVYIYTSESCHFQIRTRTSQQIGGRRLPDVTILG